MIELPWEAGVPISLAVVGLIAWLVRRVWAGHEEHVRRVELMAARAETVAHERANAIETQCSIERGRWQELDTRTQVLTTELKAHRAEMKAGMENLRERIEDVHKTIKNGRDR